MAKRGRPSKNATVVTEEQKKSMSFSKPPTPKVTPAKATQPMAGTSADNPIDLSGETNIPIAVNKHLERMFGMKHQTDLEEHTSWPQDGDYFVVSEQTVPNLKRTKKFKVVCVEDSAGKKHSVFFLLPSVLV